MNTRQPPRSRASELLTIVGMIQAGLEKLGVDPTVCPFEGSEKPFLQRLAEVWVLGSDDIAALKKSNIGSMVTISDLDVEVVNAALAEAGFPNLKLEKQEGEGNVYMAATTSTGQQNWLDEGEIHGDAGRINQRSAFELYQGSKDHGVRFHPFPMGDARPLISVPTEMGLTAVFTPLVDLSDDYFGPFDLASTLFDVVREERINTALSREYEGVRIPDVNLDEMPDISALIGEHVTPKHFIAQAKQQVRLVINRYGFLAEAAASGGFGITSIPAARKVFVLNGNFLFFIAAPGLSMPWFPCEITPLSWGVPPRN